MGILSYHDTEFMMDGEPFVIRSGSIHYFRVVPEYWEDRLKKLKACGFNTLETYTCWGLHEPTEGKFDFTGMLDLERFVQLAEDLGLYVILRPGPYICAEYDFGGLPSWLLRYPDMRIRCFDPLFLGKVKRYYDELFRRMRPHLSTNGGNIIAVQIENEYGSYGNDKRYLQAIVDLYRENQVDCLLFTSDGSADWMLTGGTLPDYLATVNFGSNTEAHFGALKKFRPNQPLMCCEFWNGWFDHWGEGHHVRDSESVCDSLKEILDQGGSVNFYMFHGGTNFGYMSGANHAEYLQPTVTSYDYDCPLNECGDRTEKYYAVKQVFEEYFGKAPELAVAELPKQAYGTVLLTEQAPLLEHAECLSDPVFSPYPLSMEELGQGGGFTLYSTVIQGPVGDVVLSIDGMRDRAQVFLDGIPAGIQDNVTGRNDEIKISLHDDRQLRLDILVENLGHVNYGPQIWQRKGITQGVRLAGRFEFDWEMVSITGENTEKLPFAESSALVKAPTFLRGSFEVEQPADTFLRLDGFTKGIVVVNGFHLGRYWNTAGPQKTLYIPAPVLKTGVNQLVILELEGNQVNQAVLTDRMDLG